jgi:hypothetical protein
MKFTWLCAALVVVALFGCGANAGSATMRDPQRDFDFEFGRWNVQIRALVDPLSRSSRWIEYRGTHVVQKVWDGRANLGVLEIDGPKGHVEGMQLRLYNPRTRRWSMTFASSRNGTLGEPAIGGFTDGRGVFFDKEPMDGQNVLVRSVTADITPNTYRDEISVSKDGGKTWKVYWIADYSRIR